MPVPERPQPRETPTNAPMLAAWRDDAALALQRCTDCAQAFFYPRALCPHCHGTRLRWFRATGRGRIESFSRIHRGLPAAFAAEAPVVLAEIRLEDGASMIARVVTATPEDIRSGQVVRLLPRERAAHFALPTFEPD